MISFLRRFLWPPTLETNERTQRARTFHRVMLATTAMMVILLSLLAVELPQSFPRRFNSIVYWLSICLVLFPLNHLGKTRLASWGLVLSMTVIITHQAWTAGVVGAPAILAFVVIVLMAGLLLGTRSGALMALACLSISLGMALAQDAGAMPPPAVNFSPIATWLASSLWLGMAFLLQREVAVSLGQALRRSETELEERKRAEQHLRLALDVGRIGVWEHEPKSDLFTGDSQFLQSFRLPSDSDGPVAGKELSTSIHPADLPKVMSVLHEVQSDSRHVRTDFRVRRTDGSERTIETAAARVLDQQGKLLRILGVNIDVTEHRQAEAALRASEERFHSLIENASVAIRVSRSGMTIYANRRFRESFGFESADELIGKPLIEQWAPEYRSEVEERSRRLMEGRPESGHFEAWGQRKDGSRFPMEVFVSVVDLPDGPASFATFVDITTRKRAEADLLKEKILSDTVINGLPGVFYMFNREGRLVRWNEEFARTAGINRETATTHRLLDRIVVEDKERLRAAVECTYAEGQVSVEASANTTSGIRHFHFVARRLQSGEETYLVGSGYDITARREAEAALHASEERYRLIVETAQEGIFVFDAGPRLTFANARFAEIFGYTQDELIGRPASDFLLPEDKLVAARQAEREAGIGGIFENTYRTKWGTAVWLSVAISPIMNDGKFAGSFGMVTDITKRKQAERELADSHAQLRVLASHLQLVREAESRRIARAVHDEVGQLLTGLKMDLRWIEEGLEKIKGSASSTLLDRVVGATQLVDETVVTVQRIAAELRPVILDQLGLFAALRHESIQFQQRAGIDCRFNGPESEPTLSPDLAIACYRIAQEALTNVVRHAAATAVEIDIKVRAVDFVLEIRDNGHGIAPNAVKDINAHGLLGMLERARHHGGEVVIQPGVGGGTVVRAQIPLAPAITEVP